MKVFILGATGLIGQRLVAQLLARGDQVSILTRDADKARKRLGERVQVVQGDPLASGDWQKHLDGMDGVVNLVGEPIADRAWTPAQRTLIRDSRILSTRQLVLGLEQAAKRPAVLVQGTAVGIYGERGEERLTEASSPNGGGDFIAELCVQWEAEARQAERLGVRVVLLRTGVVLDKRGGALQKMLLPFQLFAGGPLGNGKQWFPWIHADDLVGLILFALAQPKVSGALNGTAPESVTMGVFSQSLGQAMHRPSWMPVPRFALSLLMGERADLVLASQRVEPERPLSLGYAFRYPNLGPALQAVLAE